MMIKIIFTALIFFVALFFTYRFVAHVYIVAQLLKSAKKDGGNKSIELPMVDAVISSVAWSILASYWLFS